MRYPYGKNITHYFYPVDLDGKPIGLSTDAPSIYVYKDRPTLDQARAGSGTVIESITSWSTVAYGKSIAISAIDDDNPTNAEAEHTYYVAVNYTLKAGEQIQTRIDQIYLFKALSQNSSHGVTLDIIKDIYPTIPSYIDDIKIEGHIGIGVEIVKLDLKKSGYNLAQVQDIYQYKLAIAFKTLELAAISLRKQQDDRFDLYSRDMQGLYATAIAVHVPYDQEKSGTPQATTQKSSYAVLLT